MNESFLQFVWQHQLIDHARLVTLNNEPISIIQTGKLNKDAGPDFLNAKIQIGDTLWAGDIEIHIKSSDWLQHKHQFQKQYNSVILHIVYTFDKEITPLHGNAIPTALFPIQEQILANFETFQNTKQTIKCKSTIKHIDTFLLSKWWERMVIERFENKAEQIIASNIANNSNWEETLYQTLAKNFGFKTNSDAFELLAKSLPLSILAKHKDNLMQIEALLFGQAGMLENIFSEEYPIALQNEYRFLQKKYSLTPITLENWKFSRMRPANFPSIRIAEFAQLIFNSNALTSKILESESIEQLTRLFTIQLHEYWEYHYRFDEVSPYRKKSMGLHSIEIIIINSVIPLLFAYGVSCGKEELKERAIEFLDKLPSEKNGIITEWEAIEIQSFSAFRSQALIQTTRNYCEKGKCLQCAIGHKMFTKNILL